jgi:hypothetical protein
MEIKRRNTSNFALFLIANTILFSFLRLNGPLVQVDTANYYSVAYNFLKGNGIRLFDGEYLQNAPPLFSILALPCYFFNIPENIYVWLIQLLAFNATIFFCLKLLSLFNVSNLKLASLFVLTFGFSWLHIWTFALTEAVFLPLYLAWMYFLLKSGKHTLIYSALFFTLLCLARYMAWMLLPGILLPILIIKNFWRKAVLSIIPAAIISAVWLWFNYHFNQKLLGDHNLPNKFSMDAVCDNLIKWFNALVNDAFYLNVASLIYLVLLIVTTILFLRFEPKLDKNNRAAVGLILGTGVSLLFLLLAQPGLSLIQFPRYISVLWTPIAICGYLLLDKVKLSIEFKKTFLLTAIGLHLIAFIFLGRKGNDKLEYNAMSHLAFSDYLQENSCKLGDNNLSNFPDLVWWISKKQCKYTPFLNEDRNAFLIRLGSNRNLKIIWFDNQTRAKVMKADLGWVLKAKPCFNGQGFRIITLDSLFY